MRTTSGLVDVWTKDQANLSLPPHSIASDVESPSNDSPTADSSVHQQKHLQPILDANASYFADLLKRVLDTGDPDDQKAITLNTSKKRNTGGPVSPKKDVRSVKWGAVDAEGVGQLWTAF